MLINNFSVVKVTARALLNFAFTNVKEQKKLF